MSPTFDDEDPEGYYQKTIEVRRNKALHRSQWVQAHDT